MYVIEYMYSGKWIYFDTVGTLGMAIDDVERLQSRYPARYRKV